MNLVHQARRKLAPALVVSVAAFRGNGKSRGYWQADASHFCQVGPFAAQQVLTEPFALGAGLAEIVNHLVGGTLFCHLSNSSGAKCKETVCSSPP
jgi:hypothetical protein